MGVGVPMPVPITNGLSYRRHLWSEQKQHLLPQGTGRPTPDLGFLTGELTGPILEIRALGASDSLFDIPAWS